MFVTKNGVMALIARAMFASCVHFVFACLSVATNPGCFAMGVTTIMTAAPMRRCALQWHDYDQTKNVTVEVEVPKQDIRGCWWFHADACGSSEAVAFKLTEPCLLDAFPSAQHKQEGSTMMIITNSSMEQKQLIRTLIETMSIEWQSW